MPSRIQMLSDRGLLKPPGWLPNNVMYETMMGSVAYGVSSASSDIDVYGFCIPPREYVFPHLAGEIAGFGRQKKNFEQFQEHHVPFKDAGEMYDFTIFSIVKFFMLAMENNPNMVDSLFTPDYCVLHITQAGRLVRERRKIFWHKGSWHKFLGYAHSQLHKMEIKSPQPGSKRAALIEQFGFDVKFAYHVVRLMDEVEQILTSGDIDLQRSKEKLKAIRRGEMKPDEIRMWFSERERYMQKLYEESTAVPHEPDEALIKQLLLECLESHYGSLAKFDYVNPGAAETALREIAAVIDKNRALLNR